MEKFILISYKVISLKWKISVTSIGLEIKKKKKECVQVQNRMCVGAEISVFCEKSERNLEVSCSHKNTNRDDGGLSIWTLPWAVQMLRRRWMLKDRWLWGCYRNNKDTAHTSLTCDMISSSQFHPFLSFLHNIAEQSLLNIDLIWSCHIPLVMAPCLGESQNSCDS